MGVFFGQTRLVFEGIAAPIAEKTADVWAKNTPQQPSEINPNNFLLLRLF